MTALFCLLQKTSICIGMDTLASLGVPGEKGSKGPLSYATKFHPIPHARTVICGTGVASVILNWYELVETAGVAVCLSNLDRLAAQQLPRIFEMLGVDQTHTTTIYQFGFLSEENQFAGFKYASKNGFKSERLPYGLIVKPPELLADIGAEAIYDLISKNGIDDGFLDLISQMKRIDDVAVGESHVGIGGEVHVLKMKGDAFELTVAGRLDGYEEDYAKMLQRLENVE